MPYSTHQGMHLILTQDSQTTAAHWPWASHGSHLRLSLKFTLHQLYHTDPAFFSTLWHCGSKEVSVNVMLTSNIFYSLGWPYCSHKRTSWDRSVTGRCCLNISDAIASQVETLSSWVRLCVSFQSDWQARCWVKIGNTWSIQIRFHPISGSNARFSQFPGRGRPLVTIETMMILQEKHFLRDLALNKLPRSQVLWANVLWSQVLLPWIFMLCVLNMSFIRYMYCEYFSFFNFLKGSFNEEKF